MRFKMVSVGILVMVAGAAVVFLGREEEGRVRARVAAAASALSGHPGEGDIDRLARLAGFAAGLSADVLVEAEPGGPSVRGREAVAALAAQFATAAGPRQITLSDVAVAFDDSRSRATVTAVAHITSGTGQASARDGELVRLELVKNGDQWLIARAAPDSALAR